MAALGPVPVSGEFQIQGTTKCLKQFRQGFFPSDPGLMMVAWCSIGSSVGAGYQNVSLVRR